MNASSLPDDDESHLSHATDPASQSADSVPGPGAEPMAHANPPNTYSGPLHHTNSITRWLGDEEQLSELSWSSISQRWTDNHGNWLLAMSLGIFVAGSVILFIRQQFASDDALAVPDQSVLQDVAAMTLDQTPVEADAASAPTSAPLRIEILGASDVGGPVHVAIYDRPEAFHDPEQAVLQDVVPVDQRGLVALELDWSNLPERFAIAAYHDTNDDAQLNRNAFGIPSERYGFSNDARDTLGSPDFGDAAIDRPQPG